MKRVLFITCLLWLASLPTYAQSVQEKLIGKWVLVNQEYIGEAMKYQEDLEWNVQPDTLESTLEFMSDGTVKLDRQDTSYTFTLEDSILLLKTGLSTYKLIIEKITDQSLQLLYLDLMIPKLDAFEHNIIQSRAVYKYLLPPKLSPKSIARPLDSADSIVVEEMPKFPGGVDKLMNFLSKNVRYPKEPLRNRIRGSVLAGFTVSSTGEIINGSIIRSPRIDFALETVRALKRMPLWTPGKQNGKPVAVKYILPITFRP